MNADYCFTNGKVVNVYSGEILDHHIAVSGERILYVGPSPDGIDSGTRIIDVKGDYILPGFFDAHAHADLFYNPFSYANYVLARYFKLDHLLGGIAPGRIANLLVTPSLQKPTPRLVMAKGSLVAEDTKLIIPQQTCPVGDLGTRPFAISGVQEDLFKIISKNDSAVVPAIRIVNQTVTGREDLQIPVQDGVYRPEGDVLMTVFISRDGKKVGRGFLTGYCAGLGGIASTQAHDTHGLLVVGQRFKDMALAANDVLKMGGGVSLAHGGEVKARIPLPIGGIASKREIPELANEIIEMNQVLGDLGSALDNPLWTLVFLSFTSVLQLRITYSGVYDVRKGKIIFS